MKLIPGRGRHKRKPKPKPKVHDSNLGKLYLDRDRRYRGDGDERVIRLVRVTRYWPKVMNNFSPAKKYGYIVEHSEMHSRTVGRRGKVSAWILARDYIEVVKEGMEYVESVGRSS